MTTSGRYWFCCGSTDQRHEGKCQDKDFTFRRYGFAEEHAAFRRATAFIAQDPTIEKLQRLEALAKRFLNPEDLGYSVNEAFRDEVREALGMPRVKPS